MYIVGLVGKQVLGVEESHFEFESRFVVCSVDLIGSFDDSGPLLVETL